MPKPSSVSGDCELQQTKAFRSNDNKKIAIVYRSIVNGFSTNPRKAANHCALTAPSTTCRNGDIEAIGPIRKEIDCVRERGLPKYCTTLTSASSAFRLSRSVRAVMYQIKEAAQVLFYKKIDSHRPEKHGCMASQNRIHLQAPGGY